MPGLNTLQQAFHPNSFLRYLIITCNELHHCLQNFLACEPLWLFHILKHPIQCPLPVFPELPWVILGLLPCFPNVPRNRPMILRYVHLFTSLLIQWVMLMKMLM